jgi:hypothetical protein
MMEEYSPTVRKRSKKANLYLLQTKAVQEILVSEYLFNKKNDRKQTTFSVLLILPPSAAVSSN